MTPGWHRLARLCRSPAGGLVCWFGAFTVLAVLDAVQLYAGQGLEEFTVSWTTALRRGFESHYTMAVLGLGVLWLARRFPFDRARAWQWLVLHLGFAFAYALAYSVVYSALLHGQKSVKGDLFEFPKTFQKLMVFYTYGNVAFYWLLLLAYQGWHYYQRYRERERRATELEGQLARAQLEALRMQLHPHFLFNTLNTIAALIHEQPEAADRTLTRLGELLRFSLDRTDTHEIPLRQEVGFLRRYLEIEQARFGDRLRVRIEVPAELEGALVPALVLQPIVENAIRYGVEQREGAARIAIRAARRADRLELTVCDNGPGLPSGANAFPCEGVGLSNTRSRLRHLYGDCQSLELRPAEGGGLEARLTLPFRAALDPVPQPCCPAVVVGCRPAPQNA
jgi:signal transduction histidine kinase